MRLPISTFLLSAAGLFAIGSAHHAPNETLAAGLFAVGSTHHAPNGTDPSEVHFEPCKKGADNIFDVSTINLSPNPPQAGRNLDITVHGNLKQEAEAGSIMKVVIKSGLIPLLKLKFDFCEGVNTTCPVKAGDVTFSKGQWIDERVPTGWSYLIKVKVLGKDKKQWGCVKVPITVVDPPKSS